MSNTTLPSAREMVYIGKANREAEFEAAMALLAARLRGIDTEYVKRLVLYVADLIPTEGHKEVDEINRFLRTHGDRLMQALKESGFKVGLHGMDSRFNAYTVEIGKTASLWIEWE